MTGQQEYLNPFILTSTLHASVGICARYSVNNCQLRALIGVYSYSLSGEGVDSVVIQMVSGLSRKGTITRISELLKDGYILRSGLRRHYRYYLTDKGKCIMSDYYATLDAARVDKHPEKMEFNAKRVHDKLAIQASKGQETTI